MTSSPIRRMSSSRCFEHADRVQLYATAGARGLGPSELSQERELTDSRFTFGASATDESSARQTQPEGSTVIRTVTTVVIGAGHAGLAMSRCLAERSIDHVVLERGEVANTWRSERWDSLRLLTPNWQSRLPGFGYSGDDPDGYRTVPEVVRFIEDYAKAISAPVETNTTGDIRSQHRRRLSGADGTRRLAMPGRRAGVRRVQHRPRSRVCRSACRHRSPA